MAKRRTKKQQKDRAAGSEGTGRGPVVLSPAQKWAFRLIALMVIPALAIAVLEGALRVAGYGYPTHFFLHETINGQDMIVENKEFTARFFGRSLEQPPVPIALPAVKPAGTVRIFVLGESAALGDPQPSVGMARFLEVLLRNRYPGTHFEVVSPATVGISSHAVRCIAKDCAEQNGDIWVVYMGNNEVVGPYGAGTIFSARSLPLPLIRASIALKSTRIGQLFDDITRRLTSPPASRGDWRGMSMFVGERVRHDDPAMTPVYDNFRSNLKDIIGFALRSNAKVIVSTVASNLKDCAPFASLHRRGLTPEQEAAWDKDYQAGVSAQNSGKPAEAIEWFSKANALDSDFADLQFRWGQCELALGRDVEVARRFTLARDRDALRFRADSRINEIIRDLGKGRENEGIGFVDAQDALAHQSPHGVTGADLLYEHVHLNFEGNYAVARLLADQVAKLLPADATAGKGGGQKAWLPVSECARQLAWSDWTRQQVAVSLMIRIRDTPFTYQLNHADQYERLKDEMETNLVSLRAPGAMREAAANCQVVASATPNDWMLLEALADLQQNEGDYAGALQGWQRLAQMLPTYNSGYCHAGMLLTQMGRTDDAVGEYGAYLRRAPDDAWAMDGLGQTYSSAGKFSDAIQQFDKALRLKPAFGEAHLHLGMVLAAEGKTDDAKAQFRQAIKYRSRRPDALVTLGDLCLKLGWTNEAVTNYSEAVEIVPIDAITHLSLGKVLASLGRTDEARQHCAEAVRLFPQWDEAHLELGTVLASQSHPKEALREFQEALRINPGNTAAQNQISRLQAAQLIKE